MYLHNSLSHVHKNLKLKTFNELLGHHLYPVYPVYPLHISMIKQSNLSSHKAKMVQKISIKCY